MGSKDTEENIWCSKRKWCVEDLHHSRVDEIYVENQILSQIRKGRLRWLGHVERMSEERTL
jgi:hypothetical protein